MPSTRSGGATALAPLSAQQREQVRAYTERSARRWFLGLSALAAVAVLALIVVVVALFTNAFVVKKIDVRGESLDVPAPVVNQAVGNVTGARLATLDVSGIRSRLIAIPAVSTVSVTRSWPDRLVIAITARTPVVAVRLNGRRQYAMTDKTGFAYRWANTAPPKVPVAYVSVAGPAQQQTLTAVATVAQAVSAQSWLSGRVISITAGSPDSIQLNLNSKVKVIVGSADDLPVKLQVLQPLMKQTASVYDISAPGLPVTR